MYLVLLRHGEAERGGRHADADRPLLAAGERQAARAGAAFRRIGMHPARLWTSPALRCRRTGEIVAVALGLAMRQVEVREELAAGSGGGRVLAALRQDGKPARGHPWWILVGHEPDLMQLLQHVLMGEQRLFLPPGGCVCVEFTRAGLQAPARLRWVLPPEWMELVVGTERTSS